MDEGLLKQTDPAAVNALNQTADTIRKHLGGLGIAPEDVACFIGDILRRTAPQPDGQEQQ
jgi:hypothetical protein